MARMRATIRAWWRRHGLTVRLTAPLLAVSVALLLLGVGAAWKIHRLDRLAAFALAHRVSNLRAAEELEILIREIRTQMNLFLLTNRVDYLDRAEALRTDTEYWLQKAERGARGAPQADLMRRVREQYAQYVRDVAAARAQRTPALQHRQINDLTQGKLTDNILHPAHQYLDMVEEEAVEGTRQNNLATNRTALALLVLGVCGAASGLLAGAVFARAVRRSMVQLSLPVHDAAGKLAEVVGPLPLEPGSGFDELQDLLRKVANQVRVVVSSLQQSQREAMRAEQLAAVGQMAAGLAHELCNPLMAMKLLIQSAGAEAGEPYLQGRDVRVLEEEIERLEKLLRSFLGFARPARLEKRRLDFWSTVERTVALVDAQARQQELKLCLQSPSQPLWMEGDEAELRQVILNLLLNAFAATPPGGKIEVTAEMGSHPADEVEKRWIVLTVADSGCGLPPELATRIFEPFVSTRTTGLGLGLWACKRIVEAHGGQITAANRPDGGAAFTVRVPAFDPSWDDECVGSETHADLVDRG